MGGSVAAKILKQSMEDDCHLDDIAYHFTWPTDTSGYTWRLVFGDDESQQYAIKVGDMHSPVENHAFVTNVNATFGFSDDITPEVVADPDLLFIDSVVGRWGHCLIGQYAGQHGLNFEKVSLNIVAINKCKDSK